MSHHAQLSDALLQNTTPSIFYCSSNETHKNKRIIELFWVVVENSPRRLIFCRPAYSPHATKYSWRFLLIRLCILYLWSPITMHAKMLLAYSVFLIANHIKIAVIPCTLKGFGVFSVYDKILLAYAQKTHKEWRIRWNKFALFTVPGNFKGTYFEKTRRGYLMA